MPKRLRCQIVLTLAALVLSIAPLAVAQPPADPGHRPEHAGPPQDVVDKLLERGFQRVQPSIFERAVEGQPSSYETVVYGIDGHQWLLGQQQAFLQFLQQRYDQFPAPELLDAIDAQGRRIEETQNLIAELKAEEPNGTSGASLSGLTAIRLGGGDVSSLADAASSSCTTSLSRSASAGSGSIGPLATAGSSFSDNCGEQGSVSALSTAQGTDAIGNVNTYFQNCPSFTGGNVSCDTSATVDAVTDCFSSSIGQVTFGSITYTVSQSSAACRVLSATLSGTTSIFVPFGTTRFGSWSVSASGGTPGYNYQWLYNNGAVGGNSTSYSRSYTHPGFGSVRFDVVKVTVSDSSSPTQTVTRQITVRVEFESSSCTDPCICPVVVAPSTYGETNAQIQPCKLEP